MKNSIIILSIAMMLVACTSVPMRKTDAFITVPTGVSEMTPQEARPALEAAYVQFIDVRTVEEYNGGHAVRTRNIPLDTVMQNLDKLEKNEPVYLICQTGIRSMKAAQMLSEAGFPQTISIKGGTVAWQESGLPITK